MKYTHYKKIWGINLLEKKHLYFLNFALILKIIYSKSKYLFNLKIRILYYENNQLGNYKF